MCQHRHFFLEAYFSWGRGGEQRYIQAIGPILYGFPKKVIPEKKNATKIVRAQAQY